MGRKALFACLFAGIWLAAGCEATEAGSMELVFSWPEEAPDFAANELYLRGELQVWPDGVDDDDNPVTVTQIFTGRSALTATQSWVKLGSDDSLTFDGLSYDITLGVVIRITKPNSDETADPPGPLQYYGRSQPFTLAAGQHTVVNVPLAIEAAPGIDRTPEDPDAPDNPDDPVTAPQAAPAALRVCHGVDGADPPAPEDCLATRVRGPTVWLFFEAPNATKVVLANDASFSLGMQTLALSEAHKVSDTLYRWPTLWDLDAGLPVAESGAPPDGPRSVVMKLRNALGLESEADTLSVTVDTAAPDLLFGVQPEQEWYRPGQQISILMSANETLSGPPQVSVGDTPLTLEETVEGSTYVAQWIIPEDALDLINAMEADALESATLRLSASDLAGNTYTHETVLQVDGTPPRVLGVPSVTLLDGPGGPSTSECPGTVNLGCWTLGEGTLLEVRLPMSDMDADLLGSTYTGGSGLDLTTSEITFGGFPLSYVSTELSETPDAHDTVWHLTVTEAAHQSGQGSAKLLQGTLRDGIGNTVSVADAVHAWTTPDDEAAVGPAVLFDFTPPQIQVASPTEELNDGGDHTSATFSASQDTVGVTVQGWRCEGHCAHAPDNWSWEPIEPFAAWDSTNPSEQEDGFVEQVEGADAGTWEFAMAPWEAQLPEGTYVFSAVATDRIGLSSADCTHPEHMPAAGSWGCWIALMVVDLNAPVVGESEVTMATTGAPLPDSLASSERVRIRSQLSDTIATLASYGGYLAPLSFTLRVGDDVIDICDDETSSDLCCEVDAFEDYKGADLDCLWEAGSDSPSGLRTIQLEVSDGLRTTTEVLGSLVIDNVPPAVTYVDHQIQAPPGSLQTAPTAITFSSTSRLFLSVTEALGAEPEVWLEDAAGELVATYEVLCQSPAEDGSCLDDPDALNRVLTLSPSPQEGWVVSAGTVATYTVRARLEDTAGNTSGIAPLTLPITVTLDTEAPTLTGDALLYRVDAEAWAAGPPSPDTLEPMDEATTVVNATHVALLTVPVQPVSSEGDAAYDPAISTVWLQLEAVTLTPVGQLSGAAPGVVGWTAVPEDFATYEGSPLDIAGRLVDRAGNVTDIATNTHLKIDLTPPTLLVPAPFGHLSDGNDFQAYVSVSPDTTTLTVTATPCDGYCDHLMPTDAWQVSVAESQLLPADAITPVDGQLGKWHIALDWSGLQAFEEGRYAISAVATDAAGLTSTECVKANPDDETCWLGILVLDRTPPVVDSAAIDPAPLENASPQSTSLAVGSQYTITASYSDTVATGADAIDPLEVTVRVGSETVCTDAAIALADEDKGGTLECQITVGDTPSGTYPVHITVSDGIHMGLAATTHHAGDVVIDNTPPTVTTGGFRLVIDDDELLELSFITSPDTVQVEYSAWRCLSSCTGNGIGGTWEWTGFGEEIPLYTDVYKGGDPTNQWTFEPDLAGVLSEGMYGISAALTDGAGLTSSTCVGPPGVDACPLGVLEVDLDPPEIEVTGYSVLGVQPPDDPDEAPTVKGGDALQLQVRVTDQQARDVGFNLLTFGYQLGGQITLEGCTTTWSEDGHEADLDCEFEVSTALTTGTHTLEVVASDAVHTGDAASVVTVGTLNVDNTPPALIQTTYVPEKGTLVRGGQSLQVSLSFNEKVTSPKPTLILYPEGESPHGLTSSIIKLFRVGGPDGDGPSAVHTWEGTVPLDPQETTDGLHMVEFEALDSTDLAGNPYVPPFDAETFIVDTTPLVLADAVVTIERNKDNGLAEDDHVGIGDMLSVQVELEGEPDDFSPEASELHLGGLPLSHEAGTMTWSTQLDPAVHESFNGPRTLSGFVIDLAGNQTLISTLAEPPTYTIDCTPPEVSLASFVPSGTGFWASVGETLQAAISFNEQVHIKSGTLTAQAMTADTTITLTRRAEDPDVASGHQWTGVVAEDPAYPLPLIYTVQPKAYDLAGNPWAGEDLEAFTVDRAGPVVEGVSLSVTPADDGFDPKPGYAGLGDTVVVIVTLEGEEGQDGHWVHDESAFDLEGVPLVRHPGSGYWRVTIDAAAHENVIGERRVQGQIRDNAGNLTELSAALYPEINPWPRITIDPRPPGLAIPPQLARCDGYAPAQVAENVLHVKGDWDFATDCPTTWGEGSCSDPDDPEGSRIEAAVRMTFVLDEDIQLDTATVAIGDTGAEATIDHCLSSGNKVVAWYAPDGTEACAVGGCGDSACDAGETCTNCPEDCGACAEDGCGDGVCELYPYSEAHLLQFPLASPAAPEGHAAIVLSVAVGDTLTYQIDYEPGGWGTVPELTVTEMESWDEIISLSGGESESATQTFDEAGRHEFYVQYMGSNASGGFDEDLHCELIIVVEAALVTEDCESCTADCGTCECVPDCDGEICGDDGCGGSCGACPLGSLCDDGDSCVTSGCSGWNVEAAIGLAVADLAGNAATATEATLFFDLEAPESTDVNSAGAVTLHRYPWGADGAEPGAPQPVDSSRVVGLAGAAQAGERIVISAGAQPGSEVLNSGSVDGATVDEDGAFEVELTAGNRPEVYLQVRDRAGNASDADPATPAREPVRIRDVTWTATLAEKVPGSTLENPHQFMVSGQWPRDRTLSEPVEYGAGDGLATSSDDDAGPLTSAWTRWTQRSPDEVWPTTRYDQAIAHDTARGVTVLFGGQVSSWGNEEVFGDTWEFGVAGWVQRFPEGPLPRERAGHAMVYDPIRGVTVLFGGMDVLSIEEMEEAGVDAWKSFLNDLWEWDGEQWTKRTPLGSAMPPPRAWHDMAFDTRRGVIVLFGGYHAQSDELLQDTWEWDGHEWHRSWDPQALCEGTGGLWVNCSEIYNCGRCDVPESFDLSGMEPVNCWSTEHVQQCDDPSGPGQTQAPKSCDCPASWVWHAGRGCIPPDACGADGAEVPPPVRARHRMAYDQARGVIVLYGGVEELTGYDGDYIESPLDDLWEWDGATWLARNQPEPRPPATAGHAMAYDLNRELIVVVQGAMPDNETSWDVGPIEQWAWDGEEWEELVAPSDLVGPAYEVSATMVYDVRQAAMHVVGGAGFDTGSYGWHDLEPAGSGGFPGSGGDLRSWLWTGTRWFDQTADDLPVQESLRGGIGLPMVYDPTHLLTLLYGATNEGWTTWRYEPFAAMFVRANTAETYQSAPPHDALQARKGHTMVHDAIDARVLLLGGAADGLVDVWEWSGTTSDPGEGWADIPTFGESPPTRTRHAAAHDTGRDVTVLFGGHSDEGARLDTWEWDEGSWTSSSSGALAELGGRSNHAMSYDAEREVTVLFGGQGETMLGDTWEWTNEEQPEHTWVLREPQGDTPPPRAGHFLGYDPAWDVTILIGGHDGTQSTRDIWLWDGDQWHEVPIAGSQPTVEFIDENTLSHTVAWDSDRQRAVLFGGAVPTDPQEAEDFVGSSWEWDPGLDRRPGQGFTVDWLYAQAPSDANITSVDVRWDVGASGHSLEGECVAVSGAQLRAWTEGKWKPLEGNTANPDAPEALTWQTTDPDELRRLFFGKTGEETLSFAVTPTAPNGCGTEYGQIATDYVAVTVGYRLPAD